MTIYILYMLFKRLRKKFRSRMALRRLVAEKAGKWPIQIQANDMPARNATHAVVH